MSKTTLLKIDVVAPFIKSNTDAIAMPIFAKMNLLKSFIYSGARVSSSFSLSSLGTLKMGLSGDGVHFNVLDTCDFIRFLKLNSVEFL